MGTLLEKSGDQDRGKEREAKDTLTLPPPSTPAEQHQSPRQTSCLILSALFSRTAPCSPHPSTREGCSISTCASGQWDVGVKVPGPRPLGLEVALATVSVVMLHRAGGLLVRAMQGCPSSGPGRPAGQIWTRLGVVQELTIVWPGPGAQPGEKQLVKGEGWVQQELGFKNQFTVC